jgi:hypothetical protein
MDREQIRSDEIWEIGGGGIAREIIGVKRERMGEETRPTPLCLGAVADRDFAGLDCGYMGETAPISTARKRSNVLDIVCEEQRAPHNWQRVGR